MSAFTWFFITSSTTRIDASSVTRKPASKRVSTPASLSARVMALPPPWTTIGRMPTTRMNATSVSVERRAARSSWTLPPSFTTMISPRKSAM